MRQLALVPLFLIASLLPFSAGAVGLGSIEMSSALNQRLDAEIPLRGVSPDQTDRVTVGLASERAFREVGLPRPLFLTHLRFDVIERDGDLFVHVTSRERITEPFLSFLLEVDAPSGSLRREYTVLLDPPVYATDEAEPVVEAEPVPHATPEPEEVTEPAPAPELEPAPEVEPEVAEVTEPAVDTRRREQRFGDEPVFLQIERELDEAEDERRREAERLAAEEEARRERVERQAAEPELPGSYETARGDTAWNIAARLADDETSVQQMMLALLRYNPEAFEDGNINRLRSGYVLRVPSTEQARAVDAQTAIAQVDRQNTLWREWRDQVRRTAEAPVGADAAPEEAEVAVAEDDEAREELRIVGADDGGEVAAEDDAAPGTAEASEELQLAREQLESARMERDELASRVGELESTIDRMERLITVREEQLSALQDRLIEVAEGEGVDFDPDIFLDEEEQPEAAATAPEALDIDIVTTDDVAGRLADAAAERQDVLVAQAEAEAEAAAAEEAAAADEEDETAIAVVHDSGVQTERMQPQDDGWLGPLSGPLAGVLGLFGVASAAFPGGAIGLAGAGVAILALIALLLLRRRQEAEAAAEAAGAEIELDDDGAEDFADLIGADEDATEALAAEDDLADDSGLQDPAVSEDFDDERAAHAFTDEDPLASLDEDEVDISEGEKDDTIAEAEVYLAYGLHQQARDLLTLALQESPRRADYHEKLLETLYSAGEREEFESQAEHFHQVIDDEGSGLWKRVVAMGREIAPDNALFRDAEDPGLSAADLRPEKPASTDFDLESGETSEVDLDFSLDEGADMDATQVDFGEKATTGTSAAGGFDQTVRMSAAEASRADLADGLAGLMDDDDEQQAGSDYEDTQFVGAGESENSDVDDLEFDLGDLEDFADDNELNQRESVTDHSDDDAVTGAPTEAVKPESAGSDEEDALEFDLSDFGEPAAGPAEDTGKAALSEADFDLEVESAAAPNEADAPDATDRAAGDEFNFDLSDLEAQEEDASNLREQPTSAAGEDATQDGAETAEFDLSDLEAALDAEADAGEMDAGADGSATAAPRASEGSPDLVEDPEETVAGSLDSHDDPADIEFDLDELDGLGSDGGADEEPRSETGNGVEPTPTAATDGGNGSDRESRLAAMEETGEGDDELDTMLDLARAYIDMGDEESATSALEEVITGGSERQRQEAQKLLDSPR